MFEILEWENKFTLGMKAAKNTNNIKKFQIKIIVQNLISYRKLTGCICLAIPGMELMGLNDWHGRNTGVEK